MPIDPSIANGKVYAMGRSNQGQVGTGSTGTFSTWQEMTLPSGYQAVSIGAGLDFSIVALQDGRVYGAGYNNYGVLGLGNTSTVGTRPPVQIPIPTAITKVVAGNHHALFMAGNQRYF